MTLPHAHFPGVNVQPGCDRCAKMRDIIILDPSKSHWDRQAGVHYRQGDNWLEGGWPIIEGDSVKRWREPWAKWARRQVKWLVSSSRES